MASYETPPAVELKIEGELCNITCFCKSISYTIIRHYLPYEIRTTTFLHLLFCLNIIIIILYIYYYIYHPSNISIHDREPGEGY